MSASNQKKVRKEKATAYMSERQRAEAQEQKKLKIYTATFWIVVALCVSIFVGTVVSNPIKNVIYRNTDAMTIGDHTLSAVEVNYFYIDAVNDYVNQNSAYISYIMDTKTPLNEQIANKETGATWADNFLDSAKETIKSTYELYDLAMENGHKLSEDEQKSIDSMMSNLELYASLYGYNSADAYLRNIYGNGATTESYRAYYEVCELANSYYTAYAESLEYDDADLRAYEKDKFIEYSSFSYISYYLNATKFREGGTKDDKGNITYSEDEKAAAIEKAKNYADSLVAGEYADKDALDAAIKALDFNKDVKEPTVSTLNEDILHSKLNSLFTEWLTSEDRTEGEMTVIANESGSGDNKTVNGYYVIKFVGSNDNTFNLKNVRHVLIKFEGGKYNATTGTTTYTDAEKKAAKLKAEKLLAEWEKGDKSEDSFVELAKKNSKDGNAADGGLYEDVYPGQMVENFENWCYDDERKAGDYGLIDTEYGYHIMFYVGESEVTYRDFMLEIDLKTEELKKWHEDLVKAAVLTDLNLKYVEMDLVLSA